MDTEQKIIELEEKVKKLEEVIESMKDLSAFPFEIILALASKDFVKADSFIIQDDINSFQNFFLAGTDGNLLYPSGVIRVRTSSVGEYLIPIYPAVDDRGL